MTRTGSSMVAVACVGALAACQGLGVDGGGDTYFTAVSSPVTMDLKHVHGSSPDDVWATGLGTTFAHYDGTTWSSVAVPSDGASAGVFVIAPTDVWALGLSTILHFDGTTWTAVEVPFDVSALDSVWASRGGDVWIAGVFSDPDNPGGGSTILHWDGTTWTLVPLDGIGGGDGLLWGSSADDVWLAQQLTNTFQHWDGSQWSTVDLGGSVLNDWTAIWGAAATDVWVIGNAGGLADIALHWDGVAWRDPMLSDTVKGGGWEGMWGYSASDVWAVGVFGTTLHWNGTAWLIDNAGDPDPSAPSLFAVWGGGASGVLWGVGANGMIAQHHE